MSQNERTMAGALRATIIGGAMFLIPGVIGFLVLAKVLAALRSVALVLGPRLGIETPLGGLFLDLVLFLIVLLLCLVAGVIAQRSAAQRLRGKLDDMLLTAIPGYTFVKGLAENIHQSEAASQSFIPVTVTFGEFSQVAFETDRYGDHVAIYLPGAPNPWSGSVLMVTAEKVRRLQIPVTEALQILRALGKGSGPIAQTRNDSSYA